MSFPEYFPTEVFKFERDLEQPHVVRIFVLLVAVEGAQVDSPQVYVELPTAQITIEPAQATQTTEEDETLPPEPTTFEFREQEIQSLRELVGRYVRPDQKILVEGVEYSRAEFLEELPDLLEGPLTEIIQELETQQFTFTLDGQASEIQINVAFASDLDYDRFIATSEQEGDENYIVFSPRYYLIHATNDEGKIGQRVTQPFYHAVINQTEIVPIVKHDSSRGLAFEIIDAVPEPVEEPEDVSLAPTIPEFPEEEDRDLDETEDDYTEARNEDEPDDDEQEAISEIYIETRGEALRGFLFDKFPEEWQRAEQAVASYPNDPRSRTDLPGEEIDFSIRYVNGRAVLSLGELRYSSDANLSNLQPYNKRFVDNFPAWIRVLISGLERHSIALEDLEDLTIEDIAEDYEITFNEHYVNLDLTEKKEDWDIRFNEFLKYLPDNSPRKEGKKDSVVVLYSLNTFEVFECYDKKTLREALIRLTGISVKDGTFSLDHLTGYLLQDGSYELAAVGYTAFTGRRGRDKTPNTATCDLRVMMTKRADIEANKADIRTKMQERFFDEEGEINEAAVEERIDQVLKNRLLQAIQEAHSENRFEAILEAYLQVQTSLQRRYRDTGKQVCAYLELPDFFFANEEGVDDAKAIALANFCESGDEMSMMQEKLNELAEETFFSSVYVVAEKELQVDDQHLAALKILIGKHLSVWLGKEKEVTRVTKAVADTMPGLLMKLAAVEPPLDEAKAVALLRVVKALNHTPRLFPAMNIDIQSDIEELAKTTSPRLQRSLREDLIRKKEWKLTDDIIDHLLEEYREARQVSDVEEFVRLCARIQPAITEANARLYWQGRNGYYNKTKYNEALGRCIQEKQRMLETQDVEAIRLDAQLKEELQRVVGQVQGKFDKKFKITELQNLTEQALVAMVMRMVRVMNNPGRLIDNREAFAEVLEDLLDVDIDPDDDEELSLEELELDDDRDDDEEEEGPPTFVGSGLTPEQIASVLRYAQGERAAAQATNALGSADFEANFDEMTAFLDRLGIIKANEKETRELARNYIRRELRRGRAVKDIQIDFYRMRGELQRPVNTRSLSDQLREKLQS